MQGGRHSDVGVTSADAVEPLEPHVLSSVDSWRALVLTASPWSVDRCQGLSVEVSPNTLLTKRLLPPSLSSLYMYHVLVVCRLAATTVAVRHTHGQSCATSAFALSMLALTSLTTYFARSATPRAPRRQQACGSPIAVGRWTGARQEGRGDWRRVWRMQCRTRSQTPSSAGEHCASLLPKRPED